MVTAWSAVVDHVAVLGFERRAVTPAGLGDPRRGLSVARESAQAWPVALSGCQRHMSSVSRDPLLNVMTRMPSCAAAVHK